MAVQQADVQDATQMIRRVGLQRRMIGQRLGEAVLQARNPKNRSRAQTLLGRVKTLQQQHRALDRVESQLQTITDINSTHTVLSSVSRVFSVENPLPGIDEIEDVQDALAESQEQCHEVEQVLKQGFFAQADPQTMSDRAIQEELDLILGVCGEEKPQDRPGPSVPPVIEKPLPNMKMKTTSTTTSATKTQTTVELPKTPKTLEKTTPDTATASISRQPLHASGTRAPVTLLQPKGQKPRLVLS